MNEPSKPVKISLSEYERLTSFILKIDGKDKLEYGDIVTHVTVAVKRYLDSEEKARLAGE